MEKKAQAFLKAQLEEGKQYNDIRIAMISEGYGTDGFDDTYHELADELGIKEPKPAPAKEQVATAMTAVLDSDPLPSLGKMFKYAAQAVIDNIQSIVKATILIFIVASLAMTVPAGPTLTLYGPLYVGVKLVTIFLAYVATLICSMALLYVIAFAEERPTFLRGLNWAYHNLFAVLWIALLTTCITFTGIVALIIPGLVFAILSLFSYIVLVRDNQRGVIAILRSTDLVVGHFWGILGRMLVFSIIILILAVPLVVLMQTYGHSLIAFPGGAFALALVTIFFDMLITVLTIGSVMVMYNARAREKTFFDLSLYNSYKWIYRGAAIVGFILPVALVVMGGSATMNYLKETAEQELNTQYQPYPTEESDGGESFSDFITKTRLDEIYKAGRFYQSRIHSYEGVCQDVAIEEPITCKSSEESMILYAPLSTGKAYCRDSSGFKDDIDGVPYGATCVQ